MKETIKLLNNTKEMDDNVVDSIPDNLLDNKEESFFEDKEQSLEVIRRGIKGGLSILEKQIDLWNTADHSNKSQTDDLAFRSFNGIKKTLKNLNSIVELIQSDTVNAVKNIESQAITQWTIQAHLQTLIETLKKNNLINETDLEETWNELISDRDEPN
jgi:hypothetical protein